MTYTLEISDELKSRLDDHLEEDESHEEFIEELVSMYETEGAFLQEGYSE
jgi:ferritin-like metal-binding protein YciE